MGTTKCTTCGTVRDDWGGQNSCPNRNPAEAGGCWICAHGDGNEDGNMAFDMEFDTFYHPDCLPEGVDTILEYERQKHR